MSVGWCKTWCHLGQLHQGQQKRWSRGRWPITFVRWRTVIWGRGSPSISAPSLRLIGSVVTSSPPAFLPWPMRINLLYAHSCLCAPLRRSRWPRSILQLSASRGQNRAVLFTRYSATNACCCGASSSGDAERRYLQSHAEAQQLLAGPGHQNGTTDVKYGEPEI